MKGDLQFTVDDYQPVIVFSGRSKNNVQQQQRPDQTYYLLLIALKLPSYILGGKSRFLPGMGRSCP